MNAATRPPESTPADHARWQREVENKLRGDEAKFGARYNTYDKRLTKILAWLAGVLSIIITSAAIWGTSLLVSTDKSVGILLDRPAPVSKAQYDADRQEILSAIHVLQGDVKDIQLKQAATIEGNKLR